MSTSGETRVAVVGAGYVSAYHIRALQTIPHVRIVGIVDTSVDRAHALARRFGIPGVFARLSEMCEELPDVVHVLTPPVSHARLAIEALEMGCHVFVEKPMAPTVAECNAMMAAAARAGRTLSVNHSAKDDPVIVRALDLLRRGVCGDVLSVDFYRTSDYPAYSGGPLPAAFRNGGYPFQDMGIHALYLMEAFLGPICDIDVRYRSTRKDPNVLFDEWRGTVECARGAGAFYLSWSARPIRNEIIVHGTHGNMHIDCFLQTCSVRKSLPGPKPIAAGINAITQAAGTIWHVPKNVWRLASGLLRPSPGIHAGVLRFHDSLARGSQPPVTMDEGRRMVAWLEPFCQRADADRDRVLRLKEPLEPRRILITGASGMLGRALLDRLRADGESVRVLVRRRSPELEGLPDVQVVYGDLGDPEAVDRAIAGVQLVYHLGATMRGRGWAEYEAGTVCGTSNVVQSCLKHDVERLVHVSSVAVLDYAAQSPHAVVDESAPLEPYPEKRGSYTRAKLLAERIVTDASRWRGLRSVVVRPGQIFGPGCESVSPYGAIALAGRWIAIGSGRLKLPLVHVNDVVEGLLAAATRPAVCGSIFHLVDSAPVTQRDYITRCQDEAKGALRVNYVPRVALLALGSVLDLVGGLLGRNLPLTSYRIRSIKELRFDASAARRRLGWEPITRLRPLSRASSRQAGPENSIMRWLSLARATRSVLWRLARRTRMNIVCAAPNSSELAGPGKYSLARIRPHASDADRDLAEEAMRMAGEPTGLVSARLAHGDELIGWQSEGRIVSFFWISYHERSVGPVRLADTPGRVFLYNAFTLKEHRGRRLFAALLLAARSSLGREGATELVCDVDVRNTPSARSLEKAGFVPVGRLAFLTLFNRWRWPLERTVSSDSGRQIFCPR